MKTAFTLLALLTITAAALAEDEPVGRFQLVSGTIRITSKSASVDMPVILRIDTRTGTTWSYVAGAVGKDGKYAEFWGAIPEHNESKPSKSP